MPRKLKLSLTRVARRPLVDRLSAGGTAGDTADEVCEPVCPRHGQNMSESIVIYRGHGNCFR